MRGKNPCPSQFLYNQVQLVSQFCLDELAVQAGDVGNGLVLRADSLAGAGVGAVTKAEFVHFGHHCLGTLGCLGTALRQEGELGYLAGDEEHGGAVLTSCNASAAADAAGAVHSLVCILLGDEDGVGILSLTGADGGVAAGLDDLVESGTIDHAVLDDGETGRAPGLYGDGFAIAELTHVELAGCGAALSLAVRCAVDVERAHTADTLAAVVVEDERLLAGYDEFLVHDVEGLEEGGVIGNVLQLVSVEVALLLRAVLFPELYCYSEILCHSFYLVDK